MNRADGSATRYFFSNPNSRKSSIAEIKQIYKQ